MNGDKRRTHCQLCNHSYQDDDPSFPCGGKPDPCLGTIPGVIHACCGHGNDNQAYLVLANAKPGTVVPLAGKTKTLRNEEAIFFFNLLCVGPYFVPRYKTPEKKTKKSSANP